MADLFKEILPSIMTTGEDVLQGDGSTYVPYIINRALAYHIDCLTYAQEMNMRHGLPLEVQYDYLLNTVSKYKRPFKGWKKKLYDNRLDLISDYFNVSYKVAKDYLQILTENELEYIKNFLDKGGVKN